MTDLFEGPHGLTVTCDNPRARAHEHADYNRVKLSVQADVRQNQDGSFTVVMQGKNNLADITFVKRNEEAEPTPPPPIPKLSRTAAIEAEVAYRRRK